MACCHFETKLREDVKSTEKKWHPCTFLMYQQKPKTKDMN